MKTLKKITYCAIILLLTISCKKDDLPAATQEGRNIMAAKVNGNIWRATPCWSCIGGGSGLSVSYEQSYFNIAGEQKSGDTNFYIHCYFSAKSIGEYRLSGSATTNKIEAIDFIKNKTYYPSNQYPGTVIITKIDKINKIISGTFSFKAENENDPNDIITVTDGRFDVTYK